MKYMSVSNARAELPAVVESLERTVITKNGDPVAVVLHIDDFRALQATQALARYPEHLSQVLSAHARVQGGDLSQTEEVNTDILERNRDNAVFERARSLAVEIFALVRDEARARSLTEAAFAETLAMAVPKEEVNSPSADIASSIVEKVRAVAQEAKNAAKEQPDEVIEAVAAKVEAAAEEVTATLAATTR